jgi:hypothetical protein
LGRRPEKKIRRGVASLFGVVQIVKAQTSSQSHAASRFVSAWAAVRCEIAGMGKVFEQTGKQCDGEK